MVFEKVESRPRRTNGMVIWTRIGAVSWLEHATARNGIAGPLSRVGSPRPDRCLCLVQQTTAVTPLAGGRPHGAPVPSAYDRSLGLTAVVGAAPNPLSLININRWP